MAKHRAQRVPRRSNDVPLDETEQKGALMPGQTGPTSGGLSGDAQGLSPIATVSSESIQELAATEQSFEASVVDGVNEAAKNVEQPVHTHVDEKTIEEAEREAQEHPHRI